MSKVAARPATVPEWARWATTRMEDVVSVVTEGGGRTPLLYVRDADRWVVVASRDGALWERTARRRGWLEVELPELGDRRCRVAVLETPDEIARAERAFRARYGQTTWASHFRARSRFVTLLPTDPVTPENAMVRVRGEFNSIADQYHARILERPTEVLVKQRTLGRIRALFLGADPLLDIGPGSGFETIPMLTEGHRVTALDLSPQMLGVLRARAEEAHVGERLTTVAGALGDLGEVASAIPDGHFAGAYSTFGAFDFETDLATVGRDLGRMLRPGARLAFTALNRPGLLPSAWEVVLGRPRRALRRLEPLRRELGESYPIEVHPRRRQEWDRLLAPRFRRISTTPVSVLTPHFRPDRLLNHIGARGRRALRRIDEGLSGRGALTELAEWSFLVYERRFESSDGLAPPNGNGAPG